MISSTNRGFSTSVVFFRGCKLAQLEDLSLFRPDTNRIVLADLKRGGPRLAGLMRADGGFPGVHWFSLGKITSGP